MIINEIDVEKYVKKHQQAQKKSSKLSGGFSGKGGQIGEVIDMVKKHHAFWTHAIKKNEHFALTNPQGLLNAWIDKFYGSSSVNINHKKASTNGAINYKPGTKGANAIFRIVTAILLKPTSEQQAQLFRDQIEKHLPDDIKKELGEPMPNPKDTNPDAAQNQVPNKVYKAGDTVSWTTAKGTPASGVVTGEEVKPGYTQVKTKKGALIAVNFNKTAHTHQAGS